MTKRYLGNIITQNPTAPAGPYQDSAASGVWSLAEALAYNKAGLWPTAGSLGPTGLFAGGYIAVGSTNEISYINIASTGDASDWGDLTVAGNPQTGGAASSTRAIFGAGASRRQTYDYITFATQGNALDFGDTTTGPSGGISESGLSNSTRGVWGGVQDSINRIEYLTIASIGNALDFGDLSVSRTATASAASTTRGIWSGGNANGPFSNVIDYVSIASTGNATDFGDLTQNVAQLGGASNSTRAISGGGWSDSTSKEATITYITIASTGNATDFGDLTTGRNDVAAVASGERVVFQGGGGFGNGNAARRLLDYITISTTGNAVDFGEQSTEKYASGSASNVHGGIAA